MNRGISQSSLRALYQIQLTTHGISQWDTRMVVEIDLRGEIVNFGP